MTQPKITLRFSTPSASNGIYKVNVEATSDQPNQELFGANLRFFYDSKRLRKASVSTVRLLNFQGGYGEFPIDLSYRFANPNASLGPLWFRLDGAASYCNMGFQLYDKTKPKILLNPGEWCKLFEIHFLINDGLSGEFYPALIWDLERDHSRGSFINGSDGLVMLVMSNTPPKETALAMEEVKHLNWMYDNDTAAPFGITTNESSITI